MATQARRRSETPQSEGGVIRFLRETIDELRKVVWPTPPELYRYTLVVIFTVAVIALFIWGVDSALQGFVKRFIYSAVTKG
ncbi:MAG: preprotein translocase subunit SecE [Candidatus Dormibacteraeota bacterium]|nr:preprotein translocase subunit SecE [Candidatus Dormibacteraeota bacterium]